MSAEPPLKQEGRLSESDAYRVLHLLPSAPPELVRQVYQHLARQVEEGAREDPPRRAAVGPRLGDRLAELNGAYAALAGAVAAWRAESPDEDGEAPALRSSSPLSPWELLHLDAGAPPDIVELAYRFWHDRQGGARADAGATELPCEPNVEPAPLPMEAEPPRAEPSGPAQPARTMAYLIAESESMQRVVAAIDERPLRIGTDSTCDVVVRAGNGGGSRVEARIWWHKGRPMLHAVGEVGSALLNEQPAAWAVLEHGDRLRIGDRMFRFEWAPGDGEGNDGATADP